MDILTPATDWTPLHVEPAAAHAPNEMSLVQRIAVFLGVTLPFVGLITGIVIFWNQGVYASDIWLLLAMYSLTVIGVTVGFHRLFTHRAFETVRPMRIFLAIAGSMSLQGPVIKWCAVHRRHHQASDREGDPHSPHSFGTGVMAILRGMWHSHVGWIFENDPPNIGRSVTDLVADKDLVFIDRAFFLWVALGLLIPAGISFAFDPTPWGAFRGLLWGGLVRLCLMHHATWSINSVCHIWGSRPYQSNDESRNNPIFGLVSFGEGWHNNHHAFPTSARHGLAWWQIDISWIFIKTLAALRLAWDIRLPSKAALQAKRRAVETPMEIPLPMAPRAQEQ